MWSSSVGFMVDRRGRHYIGKSADGGMSGRASPPSTRLPVVVNRLGALSRSWPRADNSGMSQSASDPAPGWLAVFRGQQRRATRTAGHLPHRARPRIAKAGTRVVGRTWRQIAQCVEAGARWGNGVGIWMQDAWNIHEGVLDSSASALSLGCGRESSW